MTHHRIPLLAAALAVTVLLSGCYAQPGLKALGRGAAPEDTLPAGFTLPAKVNSRSARLIATKDDVKYFAAEDDDATMACVIVVPSNDLPHGLAGCGSLRTDGRIVEVSAVGVAATVLVTDGFDTRTLESGGWTKISDNILVAHQTH